MSRFISLPSADFAVEDSYPEFWANMSGGRWEPMTLNIFRENIDAQTTFVDIGSWIGPTALFAANIARRVICVEPDPVAAEQLKRNVKLNPALETKIEIIEAAISSRPGTVRLGARTGKGDSMSSLLFQNAAEHWDVPAITPKDLAAKLKDEAKLFFKVDIEGGEYEVLRSFAPLAQLPNAQFLIAFHPRFLPAKSLWSLSTAMKTARALKPFAGYSIKLIKKKAIRNLPIYSFLNRFGLGIFPIHHSVLLSK